MSSWWTSNKTSFVNCTLPFAVLVIFFGRWKIEILYATGFGPHDRRPQGKKGGHQERRASLLGIYVMNLYFVGPLFAGNYGFVFDYMPPFLAIPPI